MSCSIPLHCAGCSLRGQGPCCTTEVPSDGLRAPLTAPQGKDSLELPSCHAPHFSLPLGTLFCDKGVIRPAVLPPAAGLCFFPQGLTLTLGVSSTPAHRGQLQALWRLQGCPRAELCTTGVEKCQEPKSTGSPNHCEPPLGGVPSLSPTALMTQDGQLQGMAAPGSHPVPPRCVVPPHHL